MPFSLTRAAADGVLARLDVMFARTGEVLQ
jgi:hypothetical protein